MAAVVYLAHVGEAYKIGVSVDPAGRMEQIDWLGTRPNLLHIIRSRSPYWLEATLHLNYEAKRISGEWFSLNAGDVANLRSLFRVDDRDELPGWCPFRDSVQSKKLKPGHTQINLVISEERLAELRALCSHTGRSLPTEVMIAIDRHLDYPPRIINPPLLPEVVERASEPKKKRGRPRKEQKP